MRVWLVTCLILFALVQFYEWAKGFILPLPIYVIAGAFLAIASNYDKGIVSLLSQKSSQSVLSSQTATLIETLQAIEAEKPDIQE
ncbi:hypothetical protein C7H19_19135 [Aphanothece hegewaldii CCALA 016]|uniref:Uncharacterized protein n=1 Tax=Aphanothece hegewaldii CCALA 016 TaxID=2107694 RepID=A0A2T1LTK1_9CHRO|nr:hypothetical protein [Aphanothece hegewaldii]PSF34245.1 hypothetical protein C7H19_19135 [Aphanothece hegewaldii CCALA 016]